MTKEDMRKNKKERWGREGEIRGRKEAMNLRCEREKKR